MKKKLGLIGIVIALTITSLYAGILYIDTNTGNFGCSNNSFRSQTDECKRDSQYWRGYELCRMAVLDICN